MPITNKGSESGSVLAPEELTTIKHEGSKAITKFLVQVQAQDYKQALRSTVVSMTFDGKQTVWSPAGPLVGVGYSDEKNETYYVKADNKTGILSTYYVMPFKNSATITITNHGKQQITLKRLEATVDNYQWDDRSLYFNTTWFELRNLSTQNRADLNYVTVLGSGRYVGISITIFNTCTLKNNRQRSRE